MLDYRDNPLTGFEDHLNIMLTNIYMYIYTFILLNYKVMLSILDMGVFSNK